jgi:hypothetical protein
MVTIVKNEVHRTNITQIDKIQKVNHASVTFRTST